MPTPTHNTDLPPAVRRALDAVRRRLRAYVWAEGLALLLVVLGAAFWIGLLLDWWFEPSPAMRQVGLAVAILAVVYVGYRFLLRRAFVPISDTTAALLLERRFTELGDHVLTAVHVANSPDRSAAYHPDLIAHTQRAATRAVAAVRGGDLFRRGPLVRAVAAAAVAAASIALFALLATGAFGFWLDRLRGDERPWPRRVQLEIVGFATDANGNRVHKLAEDDDLELIVRAKLTPFQAPDVVEIRSRSADGRRARDTLTRVGEAVPGRDEFQTYRYEFKRVSADMTFDIVGGDDRVRDLQLHVVARPELFSLELACEYPKYLGREPRRLPVTGGMRIPEGTRLVLRASSTKPLIASHIHTVQSSQDADLAFGDQPQSELAWDYGTLTSDDVLLVSVTDTDGVATREPYRVSLAVVPDELPQVAVHLAGIGTAITPDARIPLVGKITDEYGLDQAWFEYQIEGETAVRRPLTKQPTGEQTVSAIDAFDTRAPDPATGERVLLLEPKQRLSLTVKATDKYDLSDKPRAGSSQQFVLDVVTMAELIALLERRELELRQRFEAIFEKVTDTRNLLSRVDFDETAAGPVRPDDPNRDKPVDSTADDNSGAALPDTAQQALARRKLRVAGGLQNVTQSADEILGVAESFDDIHNQLTNNRIDIPDLKNRLRAEIAEPLHRIGEIRMPELAAQLQLIQTHIDNAAAGRVDKTRAITQADAILVDMKHVLDRMLELESYNEVISQLRAIINEQDEIARRTRERQRQRLRGMFEDQDKK